jgi:hypothetical protein
MTTLPPEDRPPAFLLVKDPARWCRCCHGTGGPRYEGDHMHCTDCHGTGAQVHSPESCGMDNCDSAQACPTCHQPNGLHRLHRETFKVLCPAVNDQPKGA